MIWSYYFIIIVILLLFATCLSIASSNQLAEAAATTDGNANGAINNKSCFHKEKQALLHFKASLEDPYGQLSTWRVEDDDCCKWSGITCNNQTHHVTVLHLRLYHLTGGIPSSMSQMTSLNFLDLSYNKLSGRIPSGTQLQSFEPSRYIGNAGLCGPPVTESCPGDEVPSVVRESESGEEGIDELRRSFYIGGGTGFALGFWMACGVLLLNRRGRHAFFPFVDFVKDWVYVKVVVMIRKLERVVGT